MNRITEYRVEIKPVKPDMDLDQLSGNPWEVVVYMVFESGDSVEIVAGRYQTPIEAGKAAGEMYNFYKFLDPSMKTGV